MELRVRDVDPAGVVLTPVGELDMSTVGELETALTAALARPGLRECLVDLAEVGFLDSTGLRVLIDGLTLAGERGVVLRVANPRPAVERVLRITSIGPLLGLPDATTPPPPGSRQLG
ncbi:STAS domain-containing protein [Micromonospora cathayae]|uniref:Anti-sigma factor antagonist n=1 Tax=Micromonospora cathayae TaxID=3028804 RepID=A0ABY7ZY20_9ACTN|nr:STAS domain-containing protein [Micromonospora sp. HUAS 3]WDZ87296.1 STAS domain-containing protein [Micromonospora sp. HUAS 3]